MPSMESEKQKIFNETVEIRIKDYKVIDEDMLDDVRIAMEQEEMDR